MAQIVVNFESKEVARYQLRAATIVIGRDPNADIHLDNRALSRRHAQLEKRGAAIWISDLGSQNGTYVNGAVITKPKALDFGDVIELGRYKIEIVDVEEATPETPVLTLDGPEGRHRFALVGDDIIIGRSPQCDIAIGHKSVSRRHIKLSLVKGQMAVEDLGSQNGTRLNGHVIDGETPFQFGDEIQVSDFTLKITQMQNASSVQDQRRNTMVIDKSEMAKAAYMDGVDSEFISAASGHAPSAQPDDALSRKPTHGFQSLLDGGAEKPSFRVTLHHRDFSERTIDISSPFTIIGEEGQPLKNQSPNSIALEGAVVLIPTAHGLVISVAGDRRLPIIDGKPTYVATLKPGVTASYGILTLTVT